MVSGRAMLLDGTPLEGVGVAPDLEIAVTAAEVAAGDKVLDAGLAEVARRRARTR